MQLNTDSPTHRFQPKECIKLKDVKITALVLQCVHICFKKKLIMQVEQNHL